MNTTELKEILKDLHESYMDMMYAQKELYEEYLSYREMRNLNSVTEEDISGKDLKEISKDISEDLIYDSEE